MNAVVVEGVVERLPDALVVEEVDRDRVRLGQAAFRDVRG